jgi:hypothetical protein
MNVALAQDVPKANAAGKTGGKSPAKKAVQAVKPTTYPENSHTPLALGKDFVEVREDFTLGRRYRHWGDWNAEVQDYLAEAKGKAAARGTPCRNLRMGCVVLENARMIWRNIMGSDEKPLAAVSASAGGELRVNLDRPAVLQTQDKLQVQIDLQPSERIAPPESQR